MAFGRIVEIQIRNTLGTALVTLLTCALHASITAPVGTGEASVPTKKEKKERMQVRLPSAARGAAQVELNNTHRLLWKCWALKEDSRQSSPEVAAAFEQTISAFKAISDKYAGTDIDYQALVGLFKLFQLLENQKQAQEIIDLIDTKFGTEHVWDAYFELAIDYLQRAHDPACALVWFEKIPMPHVPNASDKSPEGLHKYAQACNTYVKVQQPMAKCEVELGEPEKAERRYNKLIELFPEHKESLLHSLVFEIRSVATRRIHDKSSAPPSDSIQKINQQAAVRWLEDFRRRQAEEEETHWGRQRGGLRCSIEIEPTELRVGDMLEMRVKIKNVSANDVYFYYQNLYQAEKLIIWDERGEIVSSLKTAVYNWPNPKEFVRFMKAGQTFTEQFKGRVAMRFTRTKEVRERTEAQPLLIDFHDVAQHIERPGRFAATLRLTADEKIVKMAANLGFNEIWTGDLDSNEIEFNVRWMQRDELDRMIAQLRSSREEQQTEAIEVLMANKDRQAVRELMAILVSGKSHLRQASRALAQIQDTSILPDLIDLYRVSARYSREERGEHARIILETIRGLEPNPQKLDALFIEVLGSKAPIEPRKYVAYQLGSRDDPQVVAALFEAAGKVPPEVQWAAIDALGWIGSRCEVADKRKIINPLVDIMRTDPDSRVRQRAASALGRIGSDLVVPFLIEALADEDLWVGAAAANYLGRYAGPQAIPSLEKYLNRAEKDSQKRSAGDAIKYIRQRAASHP